MVGSGADSSTLGVNIEHDRGPLNGKAEITRYRNRSQRSGGVPGASIEVREIANNRILNATTDGAADRYCGSARWPIKNSSNHAGFSDGCGAIHSSRARPRRRSR